MSMMNVIFVLLRGAVHVRTKLPRVLIQILIHKLSMSDFPETL